MEELNAIADAVLLEAPWLCGVWSTHGFVMTFRAREGRTCLCLDCQTDIQTVKFAAPNQTLFCCSDFAHTSEANLLPFAFFISNMHPPLAHNHSQLLSLPFERTPGCTCPFIPCVENVYQLETVRLLILKDFCCKLLEA